MVVRALEIKMLGDRHFARIDILEVKIQIGRKLGSQKAEKYFGLLDRFFTLKLSKSEFSKLCTAIIGRENVGLHNRLITSILKNACLSKAPPPKRAELERQVIDEVANGYQRSCLQSLCRDTFTQSPRRGRSLGVRDRRSKDRPSLLGPHGKPSVVASKDTEQKILEQESPTELRSLGSRPVEVSSVEDGEEVDQAAVSPGIHSRSPVTPPLGIPWNSKGNRKVLSSLAYPEFRVETCHGSGELPDTSSLRRRLEQKLEKEGLQISLDCVNLLNNGLDTFLKGLIKPSLELASSRLRSQNPKQMIGPAVSGPNRMWHMRNMPNPVTASMLDFRSAMELNPQILGEDWPIQLEKLCLRESEN